MSANDWDECPRCRLRADAMKQRLKDKADRSYGKVSRSKYAELCRQAEQPIDLKQTLRENYECGFNQGGELFVSYRCSCDKCGFEHRFKHEQKLDLGKVPDADEEDE